MDRNTAFPFVSMDANKLEAQMVAAYEKMTMKRVQPASPEKLFIRWIASILLQERALNNYTGNQNIPSRAVGENLDALGELFFVKERPQAQAAVCTQRFWIAEAQSTAVLVPKGTRVTDAGNTLVWETVRDVYIEMGDTTADVTIRCQSAGVVGNGFAVGQINALIDIDNIDFYVRCQNITVSDDGADRASDDAYYALMRSSMDGYSDAGSKGGYIYFAKRVSTEIADVVANSPGAGQVKLYILMRDGSIATTEVKNAVLEACSADEVRPLTDYVSVADPEVVRYDIAVTYFLPKNAAAGAGELQAAVDAAIQSYTIWQAGKLGRDINPSYLIGLLMQTGVKRVELGSPAFLHLRDGADNTAPQVAVVGEIQVTNGGYEDG